MNQLNRKSSSRSNVGNDQVVGKGNDTVLYQFDDDNDLMVNNSFTLRTFFPVSLGMRMVVR